MIKATLFNAPWQPLPYNALSPLATATQITINAGNNYDNEQNIDLSTGLMFNAGKNMNVALKADGIIEYGLNDTLKNIKKIGYGSEKYGQYLDLEKQRLNFTLRQGVITNLADLNEQCGEADCGNWAANGNYVVNHYHKAKNYTDDELNKLELRYMVNGYEAGAKSTLVKTGLNVEDNPLTTKITLGDKGKINIDISAP